MSACLSCCHWPWTQTALIGGIVSLLPHGSHCQQPFGTADHEAASGLRNDSQVDVLQPQARRKTYESRAPDHLFTHRETGNHFRKGRGPISQMPSEKYDGPQARSARTWSQNMDNTTGTCRRQHTCHQSLKRNEDTQRVALQSKHW